MCRCTPGGHCRGQNGTWLGQELLLSDGVQLIWGPHTVPGSGPAELRQPLLLCLHWGQGSSHLPKESRSLPVMGPPALSPGGILGPGLPRHLAQSRVHLSAHLLLHAGVRWAGPSHLPALLHPSRLPWSQGTPRSLSHNPTEPAPAPTACRNNASHVTLPLLAGLFPKIKVYSDAFSKSPCCCQLWGLFPTSGGLWWPVQHPSQRMVEMAAL